VVRQAKIQQHRLAGRANHDVARLDVVMNDILPVQIGERRRNLCRDRGGLFEA
jgi:hypothetical protein